jgi:cell division protein FtsN
MVRRVSALSQVLKETQATKSEPPAENTAIPQSDNTIITQSDNTVKPQTSIASPPAPKPEPQHNNTPPPQSNVAALSQNDNTVKLQRKTKTEERDKITYYLNPGQFDKLEDLRIAYKKATGTRLNEQEFMRLIIDTLDLHMLL